MLSLGIDSARALVMARRRRALALGSGNPCLAARVMSRLSLENSLERFLSCAPLRNWMFLNFEWPAMGSVLQFGVGALLANAPDRRQSRNRRRRLKVERGHGGLAMIVDEELELERLDEPDTLPQQIVDWQPGRGHLVDMTTPRISTGFIAAAALGAVAVGAVAIG